MSGVLPLTKSELASWSSSSLIEKFCQGPGLSQGKDVTRHRLSARLELASRGVARVLGTGYSPHAPRYAWGLVLQAPFKAAVGRSSQSGGRRTRSALLWQGRKLWADWRIGAARFGEPRRNQKNALEETHKRLHEWLRAAQDGSREGEPWTQKNPYEEAVYHCPRPRRGRGGER